MQSRCCCPPERASAERSSRSFTSSHSAAWRRLRSQISISVAAIALAVHARPVHDVVEDRLRKRIRPLEDHADAVADRHRVDVGRVDVVIVEQHAPFHARARRQIVHAIERANERRLSAPRRPDQRRHAVRRHLERRVPDGVKGAIVDVEVLDVDLRHRSETEPRPRALTILPLPVFAVKNFEVPARLRTFDAHDRQADRERRAPAEHRLGRDRAAVRVDDALDDREPEAGAAAARACANDRRRRNARRCAADRGTGSPRRCRARGPPHRCRAHRARRGCARRRACGASRCR